MREKETQAWQLESRAHSPIWHAVEAPDVWIWACRDESAGQGDFKEGWQAVSMCDGEQGRITDRPTKNITK